MNRQLERKGKKKREYWRLIWFGESLSLNEARKLQAKMYRAAASPGALSKMMAENKEKDECELELQELPDS